MPFHFPRVFPLISDRSVWRNGKHPSFCNIAYSNDYNITSQRLECFAVFHCICLFSDDYPKPDIFSEERHKPFTVYIFFVIQRKGCLGIGHVRHIKILTWI